MYESIEVSEEGKRWEIHARSHIAELPVRIGGRLEWITWVDARLKKETPH